MKIVECRKISNDCWECSVTNEYDGKFIKFNEGHFEGKMDCIHQCMRFVLNAMNEFEDVRFFVNE